jgi:hypothetical protein
MEQQLGEIPGHLQDFLEPGQQLRRARLLSQSRQFFKEDSFNYSAQSASSASISRHRISISALLQRDLRRSLLLAQFLDAGFEPCDVFLRPRERKLTKFKGLR